MGDGTSRREFVAKALYGAASLPLASRLSRMGPASPATSSPRTFLEPFDYEGVTLAEGPLAAQISAMRAYYLAIPNDDILKGFRARAGQRARGEDLGGWYSGDPKRRTWWSNGDTFNTFGQWLSGMSRLSRATGDAEMRNKAVFLMSEWASTIEPDGWFFYSRRPWQPHYIYDKTVGGLVDMARYAGRKDALTHLSKITDWAAENLDRSRQVDSDTEWYTLSENLYRAYETTGDAKYRSFADVWRFTDYWRAFSGAGPTKISRHGHHAYSHVNTMCSAAMTYEVTGEDEFLKAIVAEHAWLMQTQCYATGGFGPDEDLVAEDGELGRRLDATAFSFETPCGCWAGFKLSRYLMQFTGQASYGDWIEKLVYNGILAALPMGPKGQTFYYSDYRIGGGRKFYHADGTWPCCSGTYPQVVSDYHDVVYFKDAEGLLVNLFAPSRVRWNHTGAEVAVEQETAFPESDSTTLTVRSVRPATFGIRVRVPAWTKGMSMDVNGSSVSAASHAVAGGWAGITRRWSPGDRMTVRFPMSLALAPVDAQHPRRVAVTYGPLVLVRTETPTPGPPAGDLARWIERRGSGLEFTGPAPERGTFVPFYKIGAGTPYQMYFDLA
jgi:uncharacterized protein